MTTDPIILVGLTGFKRSGKNAVGDIIADLLPGETKMVSFAEPLKEYAYDLNPMVGYDAENHVSILLADAVDTYGWEEAKDRFPEVRRCLQRLGTDVFRNHVNDTYWVDIARAAIVENENNQTHSVVTDVRFPNEADIIHSLGGFVFRVNRPSVQPDGMSMHASETGILDIPVDAVIDNSGDLDFLRHAVKDALFRVAYGA